MEKKILDFAKRARRFRLQWVMSNPKKVKMRAASFADPATGKRETFKIAVSVPKGAAGGERDAAQRTLDNATQIFQSLIESGRLPRK